MAQLILSLIQTADIALGRHSVDLIYYSYLFFYQVCKRHHPVQGAGLVLYTMFTAREVLLAAGCSTEEEEAGVCMCVCEKKRRS